MNPESELMGKVRMANTVVQAARDLMFDVYEDGETMLSPSKAEEIVCIMQTIETALSSMKPLVEEFRAIGARRKAHAS